MSDVPESQPSRAEKVAREIGGSILASGLLRIGPYFYPATDTVWLALLAKDAALERAEGFLTVERNNHGTSILAWEKDEAEVERLKRREQAWRRWRMDMCGLDNISCRGLLGRGPDFGGKDVGTDVDRSNPVGVYTSVAGSVPTPQAVTDAKPLSERIKRCGGVLYDISHNCMSSLMIAAEVATLEAEKRELECSLEIARATIRCNLLTMKEYPEVDRRNQELERNYERLVAALRELQEWARVAHNISKSVRDLLPKENK